MLVRRYKIRTKGDLCFLRCPRAKGVTRGGVRGGVLKVFNLRPRGRHGVCQLTNIFWDRHTPSSSSTKRKSVYGFGAGKSENEFLITRVLRPVLRTRPEALLLMCHLSPSSELTSNTRFRLIRDVKPSSKVEIFGMYTRPPPPPVTLPVREGKSEIGKSGEWNNCGWYWRTPRKSVERETPEGKLSVFLRDPFDIGFVWYTTIRGTWNT